MRETGANIFLVPALLSATLGALVILVVVFVVDFELDGTVVVFGRDLAMDRGEPGTDEDEDFSVFLRLFLPT